MLKMKIVLSLIYYLKSKLPVVVIKTPQIGQQVCSLDQQNFLADSTQISKVALATIHNPKS